MDKDKKIADLEDECRELRKEELDLIKELAKVREQLVHTKHNLREKKRGEPNGT